MDIELFITEIQNRPVIWDQTKREYSDRNLKKQAWEEVCNVFIENFAAKTVKEKNEAAVKLQKRWKGIRDLYVKDRNKKFKSGSGASTSKEYLYSHLLSFLNSTTMLIRPSKTPPPAPSDDDNTTIQKKTKVTKRTKKSSNNDNEDKLIQILMKRLDDRYQNKEKSGVVETEYNFALSLVEDLKAIHPDYKMDAKMEILGILKKYKQMTNYPPNYQGYYASPEPPRNMSSQPTMSSPSVYDDNSTTDSIYADLFTAD